MRGNRLQAVSSAVIDELLAEVDTDATLAELDGPTVAYARRRGRGLPAEDLLRGLALYLRVGTVPTL